MSILTSRELIRDGLVPSDLVNGVIYQIEKIGNREEEIDSVVPRLKSLWFALKHEIDIQYGEQSSYPNAYIFDRNERCIWGFDGYFEATGISSILTVDKQLEGKQLMFARLNI